jgi:triosephosphate isomerase
MSKKLFVVGNWKMYKTAREATDFLEALLPKLEGSEVAVYLAVPYTSIAPASHYAKETPVVIGAQNMNDAREGAFTGEIAALMLKEAGASFVLLGHSERRHIFGETNDFIHRKLLRALQDDLQPILCIGETAREREEGRTEAVLKEQIASALRAVPKEDLRKIILAYEPVWSIGTGHTPTAHEIQHIHAFIRGCLGDASLPILYGGSVKPENVAELTKGKDVHGVLVGGASLDPEAFAKIIQQIEKKT